MNENIHHISEEEKRAQIYPIILREYAALKRGLFENFEHDRDGYTAAKGAFIKEITDKARSLP